MKVTFLGTTTLLFDDEKDQILFDCQVSRPRLTKALFGKIATDTNEVNKVIDKHHINRLKAIFVSHSHYDHVLDAPYVANELGTQVYGSKSTLNVCRGGGVNESQLTEFKDGDTFVVGEFKVTIIKSIHSKVEWYNDNLGKEIEKPLKQPARNMAFKEGGSFDFYIEHGCKKYVIRPSYNYIEHQYDNINADILFLGVGGLSKDNKERVNTFFIETIDKIKPSVVIPIHWDYFFSSLSKKSKPLNSIKEDSQVSIDLVQDYCKLNNIKFKLLDTNEKIIFE